MNLQMESIAKNGIDIFSNAQRQTLKAGRMTERHASPVLMLDTNGFIQECGKSVEKVFGYRQHELVWQHISCLFPRLAEVALIQGDRLSPMLDHICHCGQVFEAMNKENDILACNLNFMVVEYKVKQNLMLIVRPVGSANA